MDLKSKIRVIEGFPSEGISYKDISTLLEDKDALREMVKILSDEVRDLDFDYVAGIEARGFMLGVLVAYECNKGFVMVRKPNKLPGETISESYQLEYGENTIEIHKDAIEKGSKVVIVDDLLATGGTVKACCNLIEKAGGQIEELLFLTELTGLNARDKLKDYKVKSFVQWEY